MIKYTINRDKYYLSFESDEMIILCLLDNI